MGVNKMLIQFNVENFKSFKNKTVLNLTKVGKCSEHPHHTVIVGKNTILKTAVIYGATASGKSNFYDAFEFFTRYIKNSHTYMENDSWIKPDTFMFDITEPTTFEVYFTLNQPHDDIEYKYGFSIDKGGIIEEWLYKKPINNKVFTMIFERSDCNFNLKGISKEYAMKIRTTTEKRNLILSIGAKLNISIYETIYNWFTNNICINSNMENTSIKYNDIKDIVKYLQSFDQTIYDVTYNSLSDNYYIIYKLNDSEKTFAISLFCESAGMKKLFNLYFALKSTISTGGVLFIDSLDVDLHTAVIHNIEVTFFDDTTNPNHAQLIFTSNNIADMDKSVFRRDEIWFVNKKNFISELYSLVDFKGEDNKKIRKDEDYSKNYLSGKYGAMPDMKKIELI